MSGPGAGSGGPPRLPGKRAAASPRRVLALGLAAACAVPASLLGVQAGAGAGGVFPDSVLFGQSAALTGPTRELGANMNLGLRAAFAEVNRSGGVHGRALKLAVRDDQYEPEAAATNARDLINSGVFALIGAVGTPTSSTAEPVASEARVPYIGPFTGAEFLRERSRRYVVNVRASYYQETEEMVARLTSDLGYRRIAILYQDDSYGNAGLTGVRRALGRRDMRLVSEGAYMRNTVAVKRALLDIAEGNPQAVIIIGAYLPAATFIKWARRIGLDALFVNISFVGSNALMRELGGAGNGVVVTQVVPLPSDATVPVVARYHAALRAADPDAAPGFVSLEGYLAGRLAAEGLARAGANPTREGFLDALKEAGPIDLGGFVVQYGEDDNQGSDNVFLTSIRGGRFVSLTRLAR